MNYEGRIFRPPSEARSLIIQATIGCSHNSCAFCTMYKEKSFRLRPTGDVLDDIRAAAAGGVPYEKVFIADGDALIMKMDAWADILSAVSRSFAHCRSVTAYASPASIARKSDEELAQLAQMGLSMVYLGLESGSDRVLELMDKGATRAQIIEAGQRVRRAGIRLSVTAISGLGGRGLWREHAKLTASALSEMHPDYIGLLTLLIERPAPVADWVERGSFELLTAEEALLETRLLLESIDAEGAVFRANHPSNYVVLKGTLNADRQALISRIDKALGGECGLRGEAFRVL